MPPGADIAIDRTAAGLGVDGPAWLSLMGPLARGWQTVVDTLMSDLRHVPQDLPTVARLVLRILEQGSPAEVFGAPREPRTQEFLARFRA